MRKIVLLLVLLLFTVFVFGYQFRIIDESKEVSNHAGFVNLPHGDRYDINGELCGMLIVRTGIEEMNIDSPLRHRLIPKEGEYWVVLQQGAWYVDLKKVDYATLMVNLRESVGKIEDGKVYEMTIDGDGGNEFITISIIAEPEGAEKWLDGELLGSEESYSVKKGEHRLEIRKTGYKANISTINVDEDNVLFKDIELEEQRPVMLTISSEPQGAELYLDGVKEGITNIQPFRFPKEYELRLVLDKYETIEEKIIVEESGNNSWNYDLVNITSIISVDVTPEDAEIYLNNQKMNESSKEVSAGMYFIEISCPGWYPESRTVAVEKGKDKKESFALMHKTGSLQVTISPMEASSILKSNVNKDINWTGSKYLPDLAVGDYELTSSLRGYKSQTNQVQVKEKETATLKVALEKNNVNSQIKTIDPSYIEMIFVEGGVSKYRKLDLNTGESQDVSNTVANFYIGKYEVTQEQYIEIICENPSHLSNLNYPVDSVSWYDAIAFCNGLSLDQGLTCCYSGFGTNIECDFLANGYRLPKLAEWEYAESGGIFSKGYKYSGSNIEDEVAWSWVNSGDKILSGSWDLGTISGNNNIPHPVGLKKANELGIYDMDGNVYEWCWDKYSDEYIFNIDQNGTEFDNSFGTLREYRGSSWLGSGLYIQVEGYGYLILPHKGHTDLGFRVCRSFQ